MSKLLKPVGVYWGELSQAEKNEVKSQIPTIEHDPKHSKYRYYKTQLYRWVICNVWTVPMGTKKAVWS